MSSIRITPLGEEFGFGVRVSGVTRDMLQDEAVRQQLNELFEEKGLVIFEEVEPSQQMHVALSNVFGPMKEHPVAAVKRVDQDLLPGVIDMAHDPNSPGIGIVEIDGVRLSQWLPWHFDHCYNDELNRAGVLRAVAIPSRGGKTGFIDGVQLYRDFDKDLLRQIEDKKIIYTLDLAYERMRFGLPKNFREIKVQDGVEEVYKISQETPRALHPAVWTRATGEKVLHVSPWMAVGIKGAENPEGDQLLAAVCAELAAKARPYFHQWRPDHMLIWDNWRLLHGVSGHDPGEPRRMQRTTIKGDYGLGEFEREGHDNALQHITV